MPYTLGSTITTSEYNTFASDTNDVWGIGTGNYGYGQTNTIASVAVTNSITATQWTTLLSRIRSAANHQGSSFTVPASVSTGNLIQIISPLATDIATIRTNRLNTGGANTTDTSNPNSVNASRNGNWQTACTHVFTVTFANNSGPSGNGAQDAARQFFNAGGDIIISAARSGGSATTRNTAWTNLLTACGTITFGANFTSKTGGSGTPTTLASSTGYFQLTTTDTVIFKQFDTNAAYTSNFYQIAVRTDTITDPNSRGGRGSVLTFTVTFQEDDSNTFQQVVDGTLTSSITSRAPNTTYLNNLPFTITFANSAGAGNFSTAS
jgi:hypothetical protein